MSRSLPSDPNICRGALWVLLFTACVAPAAVADEIPSPAAWSVAATLPEKTSAAERWQRLKAEAAAAAASTPAKPRPVSTTRTLDDQWANEVAPGDRLPDAPMEPAWLMPVRPLTPEEAELSDAEPELESRSAVAPAAHVSPTIIWPLLSLQDPRRTVRAMHEISPYYDMNVDKEIRDYANKQAAEYGVKFGAETYSPRNFPGTMLPWEAPNLYHYPLYFEDPQLERYGHTYPFLVQPFVSVGRLSTQLVALPYQMTIDPIYEPIYELGWYRPGDYAPKLHYRIPWNTRAAVVQGIFTGLLFLLP